MQVVNVLGRPIAQKRDDIPFQDAGLLGRAAGFHGQNLYSGWFQVPLPDQVAGDVHRPAVGTKVAVDHSTKLH